MLSGNVLTRIQHSRCLSMSVQLESERKIRAGENQYQEFRYTFLYRGENKIFPLERRITPSTIHERWYLQSAGFSQHTRKSFLSSLTSEDVTSSQNRGSSKPAATEPPIPLKKGASYHFILHLYIYIYRCSSSDFPGSSIHFKNI